MPSSLAVLRNCHEWQVALWSCTNTDIVLVLHVVIMSSSLAVLRNCHERQVALWSCANTDIIPVLHVVIMSSCHRHWQYYVIAMNGRFLCDHVLTLTSVNGHRLPWRVSCFVIMTCTNRDIAPGLHVVIVSLSLTMLSSCHKKKSRLLCDRVLTLTSVNGHGLPSRVTKLLCDHVLTLT